MTTERRSGAPVRLAEQTSFDEKGLHRMLRSRGNPVTQNLSTLLHTIEKDLDLRVEVKAV